MRLNIKLSALLICLNASGWAANGQQSQRFFDNSGGLVDRISPFLIADKNATGLQNIELDDRGQLTRRNPYQINNTTGALGAFTVYGGGFHYAASGTSFLGVVVGTSVYRTGYSFGGTYTNVTSTVTLTNTAGNIAQTASLNDVMVVCNELDAPFKITVTTSAYALIGAPSKAKSCAAYGNYMVLGNTTESGTAYPSRVRWSDVNTVDSWPANNYIDIEPNDGDVIVSLVSYQDSVVVFKRRSIYQILITGNDGANAFIIRPVARGIGASAKNSVKSLQNQGVAFLAQDGVYVFDGTNLNKISDPIQRTIDALSRTNYAYAVGAVYPKRNQYWLAVSTAGTTNNKVLVYDYVQRAWSVYTGMSVSALMSAEDSSGNALLLHGDYSGNIYKQDQSAVLGDYPNNVLTAIDVSYVTPELTFGAPEFTKEYKYLYVFSQVNASTITVTVGAAYDYESVYYSSATIDLGAVGAVYDLAIYDTDVYPAGQYKVSRVELNRSARSLRLRFSHSSSAANLGVIGWVIVYKPEDWKQ